MGYNPPRLRVGLGAAKRERKKKKKKSKFPKFQSCFFCGIRSCPCPCASYTRNANSNELSTHPQHHTTPHITHMSHTCHTDRLHHSFIRSHTNLDSDRFYGTSNMIATDRRVRVEPLDSIMGSSTVKLVAVKACLWTFWDLLFFWAGRKCLATETERR